jgi:hypothetical protein
MEDEVWRRRWDLPAPESAVLLWGPETRDHDALKLALLELVARRAMKLVAVPDRRLVFISKETHVLVRNPHYAEPVSPSLAIVVDAHPKTRTYRDGTVGTPVDRLAGDVLRQELRRVRVRRGVFRWDWSVGGYVRNRVLPELERRGLYARESRRRLGVLESDVWVPTTEGVATLYELRERLEAGRAGLLDWLERDPARADDFLQRLGPALPLMGGLTPLIARLRRPSWPVAEAGWSTGPFGLAALAGTFGPGPQDGLDAADLAISAAVDRAWAALQSDSGGGGE